MNKNPNAKELKQDSTSVSLLNKTHFPACPGLWLVGRAPGARNALGTSRSTRGALLAAAPRSAPEQRPPASAPGSHQLPYVTLLCICLEGPATGAVPHKGAGAGARQSVSPRCVPAVAGSAAQGGAGGTRRGPARDRDRAPSAQTTLRADPASASRGSVRVCLLHASPARPRLYNTHISLGLPQREEIACFLKLPGAFLTQAADMGEVK